MWFQKNKNEEFNGWLPSYDEDKLLATKAKGIYKPKELKQQQIYKERKKYVQFAIVLALIGLTIYSYGK